MAAAVATTDPDLTIDLRFTALNKVCMPARARSPTWPAP